jgi:hypothetical protein
VDKWARGPADFVASSNLVLADLSVRLDEYWAALTTVLVVVALLAGFWRWRRHKRETRDWRRGETGPTESSPAT